MITRKSFHLNFPINTINAINTTPSYYNELIYSNSSSLLVTN